MTTKILRGHVMDRLRDLPAESVHCVITSVPYWGLRSYGTEPQIWGGEPACEHDWVSSTRDSETFARKGKAKSAAVKQRICQPAHSDGEIDREGSALDVKSRLKGRCGKKTKQPIRELATARRKTDAASTVNAAISVENSSGEIPYKLGGQDGPPNRQTFSRVEAQISKPTDGLDRPILHTPSNETALQTFGTHPSSVSNATTNEGAEVFVSGDERQESVDGNVTVRDQQPENIGTFPCPSVEQGGSRFGEPTLSAGERADSDPSTPLLPSGLVNDSATASSALNKSAGATIGARETPPIHHWMICSKCGAGKGEHGLEPTLALWLEHEVVIWREIRRVLRKDGVAWLNVGDAYATAPNGRSAAETKAIGNDDRTFRDKPIDTTGPIFDSTYRRSTSKQRNREHGTSANGGRVVAGGVLKPKDRLMLPARLAIALQMDGWWLRDEIVWHKSNPMPSSIQDRTTPAHEMVYLLSRSARYFFDSFAIREPFAASSIVRLSQPSIDSQGGGAKQDQYEALGVNSRSNSRRPNEIVKGLAQRIDRKPAGWFTAEGSHEALVHTAPTKTSGNKARKLGIDRDRPDSQVGASVPWEGVDRNKRSVWTLATEPWREAHFATMPTELVRPMILAGTSEKGCCAKCGAPWKRNVDKEFVQQADVSEEKGVRGYGAQKPLYAGDRRQDYPRGSSRQSELGWSPSCKCAAEIAPCLVLDPFGGSGTVGVVADRLKRDSLLIELNPDYCDMAERRLRDDGGMFAEVSNA
jgi:DNA modification methylase